MADLVVKDRGTLEALLAKARPAMEALLPANLTPERLMKIAVIACAKNPTLYECTQQSVLQCVILGAELGLEAGGPLGHLWLVPFKNKGRLECTPIIGYQGYVELAYRNPRVQSVEARVVNENDEFDVSYGKVLRLHHKPTFKSPGPAIAAYSVIHINGGGTIADVMSKDDIEKIRARSRAKDSGPWVTDWDPMACKTVYKRLQKWGPKSTLTQRAMEAEEAVENCDMDLVASAPELEEAPPPSKASAAKAKVAAKADDYSEEDRKAAVENLDAEPV